MDGTVRRVTILLLSCMLVLGTVPPTMSAGPRVAMDTEQPPEAVAVENPWVAVAAEQPRDAGLPAALEQPRTEDEPNDEFATATLVVRGTPVAGEIAAADDVDIFSFEATRGERITVDITNQNGRAVFAAFLDDPGDPSLAEISPRLIDRDTRLRMDAERDGTCYVVVLSTGGTGTYELTVRGAGTVAEAEPTSTETETETTDAETETERAGTEAETTTETETVTETESETQTETETERSDPDSDVIGWENGYWHNESIDVNQSDGLSDAETDAYVARAQARVEQLREKEFLENVSVEILSREEYIQEVRSEEPQFNGTDVELVEAWYDQRYEATFIVEEGTNAFETVEGGRETTILGFYDPREGRLVVISDTPGTPVIDNATLIHELTHALQDQHVGLVDIRQSVRTSDQDNAVRGLIEGEANYIEALYAERCASGEWECVETPPGVTPDRSGVNRGAFATLIQPYSDGPVLVDMLVRQGGWEAVERAYRRPPISSEQVIHPDDYPNELPANIGLGDLPAPLNLNQDPRNGWSLLGGDTLGEAWIYSMFLYQDIEYDNEIVPESVYRNPNSGEFDLYNYTSEPSSGWGNDVILPYTKGNESGYIWVTSWDTPADAREFHDAYLDVLDGHGVRRVDERTLVIPDGGYEDAFVVVREGNVVTIVNAPTIPDLSDLYPGIREASGNDTTSGANGTDLAAGTRESTAGAGELTARSGEPVAHSAVRPT